MMRVTITHACGHKRRVSIKSAGAEKQSAEMFDHALADCPTCVAEDREAQRRQNANAASIADGGWVLYPSEY